MSWIWRSPTSEKKHAACNHLWLVNLSNDDCYDQLFECQCPLEKRLCFDHSLNCIPQKKDFNAVAFFVLTPCGGSATTWLIFRLKSRMGLFGFERVWLFRFRFPSVRNSFYLFFHLLARMNSSPMTATMALMRARRWLHWSLGSSRPWKRLGLLSTISWNLPSPTAWHQMTSRIAYETDPWQVTTNSNMGRFIHEKFNKDDDTRRHFAKVGCDNGNT